MRLRYRHGYATEERGEREQHEHHVGWPAENFQRRGVRRSASEMRYLRRRPQHDQSNRYDEPDDGYPVRQHGGAPAERLESACEDRRPEPTGDIAAARDQP